MRPARKALLLALLATASGGCNDDGDDCFECGWPVYSEVEPNDLPAQANWLDTLYPGDRLAIEGRITQFGPDLLDGFALRSGEAIQVQFALWASEPGADLDVCLYDPDLGEYIACWETPAHPETGAFSILGSGKDVHLVVSSFLGDSAYRLEVLVYAACCADGGPQTVIEADGMPALHRPGTAARWALYAGPGRDQQLTGARQVVPGELLEVDLESGHLRRHPVLLERLGPR